MTEIDKVGDFDFASGIDNEVGVVEATSADRAVTIRKGLVTDLGDLGGAPGPALVISESGQVVGASDIDVRPDLAPAIRTSFVK
jgi:uncharacterized membrane protein